jgi:hypothetical protein
MEVEMAPELLIANCVDLPGRAGELQRGRAAEHLIQELGDHYALYHTFLEERLSEIGGEPNPAEFGADPDTYGRLVDIMQRLERTERLLRRARAHGQEHRDLSERPKYEPPIWDSEHRLSDVRREVPTLLPTPFRDRSPFASNPAPRYPDIS